MRTLLIAGLLFAVACGGGKEPKVADDKGAMDPPETAPAPPPAEAAPSPAPQPKRRKPYEVVNLCPRVVTLLFDKGGSTDPKASTVGSRTLAGNAKMDDPPRDSDGNQVIWLMVREAPLVSVRVSRGTTRVEVGTSCDTLEMH